MHCLQLQSDLSLENKPSISSEKRNSTLYLHPSTMGSLSITNGCFVLVHTNRGCIVLKVNPHDAVKAQHAALHSSLYKYYESSTISIQPLELIAQAAREIYLYPEKFRSFMVSLDFQSYVTNIMKHIYIREGLVLNINYLGYSCHFTIRGIIPNAVESNSVRKPQFTSSDLLCTPKTSSKGASRDNLGFDAIQTSTPISSRKNSSSSIRDNIRHLCDDTFYFLHSLSKIVVKQIKPEEEVFYEDILALDEVIAFIKSSISSILLSGNGLLNIFPKGILLIGPSGSGKSMIGKALKSECNIPIHIVQCQDLKSSEYKDYVELERIYDEAVSCHGSVLFFDDLDIIFKDDNQLVREEKLLKSIKNIIFKSLNYATNILLIASVKNASLIPPYLRKNGLFEKELYTNISSLGRKQIFLKNLKKYECTLSEAEIDEIIEDTNGFTGYQLQQLCNNAKEALLDDLENQTLSIPLTFKDLKKSLKQMKPTIPFNFEIPNVKWSDIGGMKDVKNALTEMISWPLKHSDQFKRFKITPSRGILMYGPAGCCKTMIAKALVTEGHFNFIPVKASEIFNKYVGESEKTISDLFKKARASAPCVLFFDEVDSLTSTRNSTSGSSNVTERILTQLLTEIDGIEPLTGVCILAATNRPDIIDASFLRPGRFDHMIYVPLPDTETRSDIFNVKLKKLPTSDDINASYLVNATEGYSGAELTEVCQMAARFAIREDAAFVSMKHFIKALKEVLPRTSPEMKQFFDKYEKQRTSYS